MAHVGKSGIALLVYLIQLVGGVNQEADVRDEM